MNYEFYLQPTPPKKPPRRTVPISPTHAMSSMFSSTEQNGYDGFEYAFVRVGNSDEPEYIVGQVRKHNLISILVVVCAFCVWLSEQTRCWDVF